MLDLIPSPGKYRTKGVGIVEGSKVKHLAPPSELIKPQMADLFRYMKDKTELTLIRSCVFHYELEFIHPFMDGNGRMGRLWQTLILMSEYPLFEFLPFETLIAKNQRDYYHALSLSDKEGKSTRFIEFMLGILNQSLDGLLEKRIPKPNETQSRLLTHAITNAPIAIASSSENMRFATSIAGFGLLMKQSDYKGTLNKQMVLNLGQTSHNFDPNGYRAEFIQLVTNWNQ